MYGEHHWQRATGASNMDTSAKRTALIFLVYAIYFIPLQNSLLHPNIPEDGRLNFTELAIKYGQKAEEYDITTADGYIVKLFHIPGNSSHPVFLMHGIVDSADTFILRGNTSLAIALAEKGYDVWAGNARGVRYSVGHTRLNSEVDKEFWDFSFHEIAAYDLPAMIDFVLNKTGQASVSVVAHSQGNAVFYALGSLIPKYNEKVKVLIALAPICYLNNIGKVSATILGFSEVINKVLPLIGEEELFGEKSNLRAITKAVCTQKVLGYELCARGIFFSVGGDDPAEMEPEFFPVIIGHYPTSTSRKNLLHLYQVKYKGSFSQYDYGPEKNLELYKSKTPPNYKLKKVTMKVALFAGKNDALSTLEDVELLRRQLPNVVEYRLMERDTFNHIDYVWGRHMHQYLFPHIFEVLGRY